MELRSQGDAHRRQAGQLPAFGDWRAHGLKAVGQDARGPFLLASVGADLRSVRKTRRKTPATPISLLEPALASRAARRSRRQRRQCRAWRASVLQEYLAASRRALRSTLFPARRELSQCLGRSTHRGWSFGHIRRSLSAVISGSLEH